jgi:hypothetical protein
MSSAVLIQRPKEEGQLARTTAGVRIVSVDSRIDDVSISSAARGGRSPGDGPFEFDADLSETGRTEDSLSVHYAFTFGRPSCGQVCKMSGRAVVRFSEFNPGSDFHTLGNDVTNEMAVEIFRKNYEAAYLLHDALSIDAPSPWITRGVSLSSRKEVSGRPSDNP